MDPRRFQQIAEIYHAVREADAKARAALLEQVAPELRREVESLLAQDTAAVFLDRPVALDALSLLSGPAQAAWPVGTLLGPYRIDGHLGKGGMGEVYRATDTRLGRSVAIKRVHARFGAQLRGEQRAISALNHPNICALHDVGPDYMVMELVEGDTLAARLRQGALPMQDAQVCAAQILAGLAAAHAKGIVHRDLKPGNIMLAESGVKILDFGLARFYVDESRTATGNVMGTPAYASPEQRRGQPADPRSDIYSFGCVLYEMLTGSRVGLTGVAIAPRQLETIVTRCLHEDPAQRWQTATELAQALATVDAPPASGWRSLRLRQLAMVGAVVAVIGVATWSFLRPPARALTDRDTVVLAEFDNRTGDPVFDGTLRQGLSIQLEQSPFLSIVTEGRVRQALTLMGQKPDARLDAGTALDLCQRVGGAAVIEGSIAQIGTPYQLTLRALDCANGETLASTSGEAADKSHVLAALGSVASRLRGRLGEALNSVRRFDIPLEQATTPSLEALKAYSEGMRILWTGRDSTQAIPLFKHAIALDPDFALAYGVLTIEYTNLGESRIAADYARRAYALRNNVSEPERYFIIARYGRSGSGNIDSAVQASLTWIQAYPRAQMPRILLAGSIYPVIGEFERARRQALDAIRMVPTNAAPYAFLMDADIALDRLDAAAATYAQARRHHIQSTLFIIDLYQLAFLRGDTAGMAQQVVAAKGLAGVEDQLLAADAETAAYYGRLQDARRLSEQAMASAQRAGAQEPVATYLAMSAVREALYGHPDEAKQLAEAALARVPARDVLYGAALVYTMTGADAQASSLIEQLHNQYPDDTFVQFNYLPTLRARLALNRGDAATALTLLRAAAPFELGVTRSSPLWWTSLYPIFMRGEAYAAAGKYQKAADEFQRIVTHRGLAMNLPVAPMARLRLAQALAHAGDHAAAIHAYEELLALWKTADSELPVLQQAQAEFAQSRARHTISPTSLRILRFHRPSPTNTSKASQMQANPTKRVRSNASWRMNTPIRNCRVGAMYCRIPTVVSEILRTA